ncbi:MAG: hypothetical protein ACFFB2_01305 [Promethearchaeota archaeon]
MTENSNSEDDLELQLTQQIIDLTKLVEENKLMIKKNSTELIQANKAIEKWEKHLQDLEPNLETRFNELNSQISKLEEKVEQQTQKLKSKFEDITTQMTELKNNIEQQSQNVATRFKDTSTQLTGIEESIDQEVQNTKTRFEEFSIHIDEIKVVQNAQKDNISSIQQVLNEQKLEIQNRVQKDDFKAELDEAIEIINKETSSLSQTQESIQLELKNHIEETQAHFETLAKTIELLGDGLTQLEQHNQNHATLLEKQRESLSQCKLKLKELVSLSKEDQRAHFENFSRILESYNENIRTELTIAAQSLKESDTKILDEVSASFMPKKIGSELQKSIADLASELKTEAQKTRDDLIQGLQKNVQDYEIIMEEQNSNIKKYQQQLEQFQDEILAIIDRKVNEKYEVVFSLLSKVVIQAEELAHLIKTSEIQIPWSSSSKNKISSDNNESSHETKNETFSSKDPMREDME